MSSAENETRPVWLTREQTNAISRLLVDYDQRGIWNPMLTVPIGDILTAWDAAPADPAEAVTQAIYSTPGWYEADMVAPVVLRALGAPKATP